MYEKLISDLRADAEDAEWAEANELETPIMLSDHLKQAADAIEKMQNLLDGILLITTVFAKKRNTAVKEHGNEST